jgi:division protein CdvB (Snf7/Vps24/ESCRT-III family)
MKKYVKLELLERSVDSQEGSQKEISERYSDTHSINVSALKDSICRLRVQQSKLEETYLGLKEQDRILFKRCKSAIKKNDREKANKYAKKISEIRKTIKFFFTVQLGIERLVIRLESKLEIGDIEGRRDLKPILLELRSMSKELSRILPNVSNELENVCDVVEEKLVSYEEKS